MKNIDKRLGRLRKDLDDELMDYLKKGYPFKSNDPEIDGITYEDILEARNYAISNFDISHTAQTYLAEYKRILNKS